MKELIEKLRNGYQGIALGAEGMGWSFDMESLTQAADAIERLENELLAATLRIENDSVRIEGYKLDQIENQQSQCDLVAERDALRAELDKLKQQEPVAHVEIKHMVEARFHANCEYGCNLKDGDKLYLAAGAKL